MVDYILYRDETDDKEKKSPKNGPPFDRFILTGSLHEEIRNHRTCRKMDLVDGKTEHGEKSIADHLKYQIRFMLFFRCKPNGHNPHGHQTITQQICICHRCI